MTKKMDWEAIGGMIHFGTSLGLGFWASLETFLTIYRPNFSGGFWQDILEVLKGIPPALLSILVGVLCLGLGYAAISCLISIFQKDWFGEQHKVLVFCFFATGMVLWFIFKPETSVFWTVMGPLLSGAVLEMLFLVISDWNKTPEPFEYDA